MDYYIVLRRSVAIRIQHFHEFLIDKYCFNNVRLLLIFSLDRCQSTYMFVYNIYKNPVISFEHAISL